MDYSIVEVLDKKALKEFIQFPDDLYKDCPQYVPALHSDQVNSLTKVSSLSYCKRRMWLAKDGRKVVGRICAMINPRYNERYSLKRVRFGWFDTINDIEVARLLISTAEEWAKSEGMTEIHGPLYYNTLGKQGMLVDGYDKIPPFNCYYNYPYYNELVEALGFEKECDWVQYAIPAFKGVPEKAKRVAAIVKERYNLHFADVDKLKNDKEMVRKFFKVYNESFATSVYNFIPFTDEEIDEEAASTLRFVTNKTSCFVLDENDDIVGFAVCFPSISKALQKAKGKLFPFGWIHFLRAMNDLSLVDLMINGAAPEWQNKGVSAVYYQEMAVKAQRYGMMDSITNPQIETNSAVNLWNSYERELYMRRRCYIKKIC